MHGGNGCAPSSNAENTLLRFSKHNVRTVMTAVADPKTGCTDGGETHFHSSPRAFTLELIISMLATEFSRDLGEKEEGKMMGAIKGVKG